jgi:hypothetical protein
MQTLNTVEDYLEILGGYKRIDTTADNPYGVSPFKLANQDKLVVSNFAWQSVRGVGLTHKQSELAIKLITKYQKQLKQRGIDAKEILLAPRYRYFFRTIEKNKLIDIENNTIRIRFPYDTRLITDVYNWVGSKLYAYGEWNSVKKQWNIDLTENSLLNFYEWGSRNAFHIDNTVQELYNKVQRVRLTAEQYLPKLVKHESGYTVANASETLQNYLNNNGWGTITEDNVELLIDSCDLLGIHVSKEIKDTLSMAYGDVYYNIISNHMTKILSLPENYEVLDRYMSNNRHRLVYVISPNNLFDEDNKRFMDGLKETHPSLDMIKIANFEKESYNNLEGHILLVNMTKIFSWYWFYQSRFVINSHKIILLVSDEKFAKDVPNAQRMEVDAWPLYFNNS